MSFSLSFSNLWVTETKSSASIISGLNGCFNSGDFVAIMGPSGSGKTTLLSYLTCKLKSSQFTISSQPLLNRRKYSSNQFAKLSAYVPQDDILFPTFTVRQCFEFYGSLKLWQMTAEERKLREESVIKRLNLEECQHTLIGNGQFNKCISGGQKRRVAIGVELLSNPSILIFDEPTSGLDSHNALTIVKLLSSLSNENKLIIATIHQPSTLMYQQMNRLYLIKSGCLLYDGKAAEIVPYMENIGVVVDRRMNPMDFVMMEISEWKAKEGFRTKMSWQKWKQISSIDNKNLSKSKYSNQSSQISSESIEQNHQIPLKQQFIPLAARTFKNLYRLPSSQMNKLMNLLLIPFLLGLLYFDLANIPSLDQFDEIQQWTQDFTSFLFISSFFVFGMNCYDTTLMFPSEKILVLKETTNKLYSIQVYFWSRVFVEAVGVLMPAISCSLILYEVCQLDKESDHLIVFVGIFILMGFSGYFFGIFFGIFVPDANAITLLPVVLIPFLMYGGLSVNIQSIPAGVRWLQYISPMRHAYFSLLIDQLKTKRLQFLQFYGDVNNKFGLEGTFEDALYCNLGLMAFFMLASLVILQIRCKRS